MDYAEYCKCGGIDGRHTSSCHEGCTLRIAALEAKLEQARPVVEAATEWWLSNRPVGCGGWTAEMHRADPTIYVGDSESAIALARAVAALPEDK